MHTDSQSVCISSCAIFGSHKVFFMCWCLPSWCIRKKLFICVLSDSRNKALPTGCLVLGYEDQWNVFFFLPLSVSENWQKPLHVNGNFPENLCLHSQKYLWQKIFCPLLFIQGMWDWVWISKLQLVCRSILDPGYIYTGQNFLPSMPTVWEVTDLFLSFYDFSGGTFQGSLMKFRLTPALTRWVFRT